MDGKDSSQVWGGFRVANRAKIVSRHAELRFDNSIVLQAAHNGYKSLLGGCIHARKLILREDSLAVSDMLQGTYRYALSHFYFHPNLALTLENNIFRVQGPHFILYSNLQGSVASIVDSFWYPEFGVEIPSKALQLNFQNSQLDTVFTWTNH